MVGGGRRQESLRGCVRCRLGKAAQVIGEPEVFRPGAREPTAAGMDAGPAISLANHGRPRRRFYGWTAGWSRRAVLALSDENRVGGFTRVVDAGRASASGMLYSPSGRFPRGGSRHVIRRRHRRRRPSPVVDRHFAGSCALSGRARRRDRDEVAGVVRGHRERGTEGLGNGVAGAARRRAEAEVARPRRGDGLAGRSRRGERGRF